VPSSSLSRRELLGAFLGMPAAISACHGADPQIPPGSIVFPSHVLGHKMRDGAFAIPSAWEDAKVVIIGGGVAGLSAAWRLARAGFDDFVLLELDSAPGGTAKSGANDVSAFPWGAHYITVPMKEHRALLTLLGELGIVEGTDEDGEPVIGEPYLCRDPPERLFHGGRWYPGLYLHEGEDPEDRAQLARFEAEMDRFALMRDGRGRRAFAIPVSASSDDPETTALDRMSMAAWLREKRFSSTRLLWIVDYACRDDYGATPEQTSAWAGIFYFAARLGRGRQDAQPVITWPEGNGHLIAHLSARVAGRARLGAAAYDVVPTEEGGRAGVDVLCLTEGGSRAIGIHAGHVIFAAPQFVARVALRHYRESPPDHASAFAYGAWMVANLTLRDRPKSRGFPFAWDNVLYDSPSLGYVVATHQRCIDRGPTVITYYYPLLDDDPRAARTRLLSAGRDEWADVALTDLSRAHPDIRTLTTRLDVIRWGHAMIKPRVGMLWGGARAAAARPFRNVHFAGADLSGVALFEEAFDQGVRAAEEVLAARGLHVESLR
jgi:glycine/D-amino acid oxidase-like deaminating enzyme